MNYFISINIPETRQLLIDKTHIATADNYDNQQYDERGVPTSLILRSTHDKRHTLVVDVEPMMVIGRKHSMRDSEVTIDLTNFDAVESGVSRYHAMLLAFDDHLCLKDIGSLNGTLLNGKRMVTSRDYKVTHGDTITLGELELVIEFMDVE